MLSKVANGGAWKRVIRVPTVTSSAAVIPPCRPQGDAASSSATPLYRPQLATEPPLTRALTEASTSMVTSPPLLADRSSFDYRQQRQRQSPPWTPPTSRPLLQLYSSTPPSSGGPRLSRQFSGSTLLPLPPPGFGCGGDNTDRLVELVGRYANFLTTDTEASPSSGVYTDEADEARMNAILFLPLSHTLNS